MWLVSGGVIAFSVIYFTIFIASIVGNSCILAAVYKHEKLHTTVNILLSNVALSDLLFTIFSLANCIEFLLQEWVLTDIGCRIQGTLIEVFYTASIITLSVIAVERYLIICRTRRTKRTPLACIKVSGVIWLVSFVFCSPLFYAWTATPNKDGKVECYNNRWSNQARLIFYTIHAFFVYLLPLGLMIFTHYKLSATLKVTAESSNCTGKSGGNGGNYSPNNERKPVSYLWKKKQRQRHRKVIQLLITVTALFAILWGPFIGVRLLDHAGVQVSNLAWMLTQSIAFTNTAVNFFIYSAINPDLRKAFRSFSCCDDSLEFEVVSDSSKAEHHDRDEVRAKRISTNTSSV